MKYHKLSLYRRLLHKLEMKLIGTTVYQAQQITLSKMCYRIFRHIIYPIKKHLGIGFCY